MEESKRIPYKTNLPSITEEQRQNMNTPIIISWCFRNK